MPTVKAQKIPLRQSPLPSRDEILDRLRKPFGPMAGPLAPVLNPCAELVERMLMELTREVEVNDERLITIIHKRRHNNSEVQSGYICRCGFENVRLGYKHCPECARTIQWEEPSALIKKANNY